MFTKLSSRRAAKVAGGSLLSLLAIGWASANANAASIDTIPSWDGSNYVYSYGKPNTATYGQTFQTPDAINTYMQDFSFEIKRDPGAGSLYSTAYVYAWDGSKATGAALFTSS